MRGLIAILTAGCAACSGEGGSPGGPGGGGPDGGSDPVTVTIRQVQDPTADGWVAAGTWVRIEDVVVTARGNATDDFTAQDDRAAEPGWSGVFVAVDDPDGALPVPIQGD